MTVKRWLAMGPEELRRRRRKLKLTQAQFGRAIGLVSATGDGRTVREWELGNRRIPGTVKILIGLMAAYPEVREELIGAQEPQQMVGASDATQTMD